MKKELEHFYIENNFGANQDEFKDVSLKIGGCAVVAACDTFIAMVLNGFSSSLIPISSDNITMDEYERFSHIMKPYLHPRLSGIHQLSTFTDGITDYLQDHTDFKEQILISPVSGELDVSTASRFLMEQINAGIPAAFLLLMHNDKAFSDYQWHWFLLNGYEQLEDHINVQIVTYGEQEWVDFRRLWDTGKKRRGGMVLIR